ncbi:MAG: hypothetical protein IJI71_03195 [Clostridia bacterium]|nr:hypothetical protein [Clostridia bacterium]
MQDAIIEVITQVLATLLITLIGVLGTWLTAKVLKRVELTNINKAKDELVEAAQRTVLELQQTVVEGMKAAAQDGKLSEEEITELSIMLLNKTKQQMSLPAIKLLEAAAVDVNALIRSAGEALIAELHDDTIIE